MLPETWVAFSQMTALLDVRLSASARNTGAGINSQAGLTP